MHGPIERQCVHDLLQLHVVRIPVARIFHQRYATADHVFAQQERAVADNVFGPHPVFAVRAHRRLVLRVGVGLGQQTEQIRGRRIQQHPHRALVRRGNAERADRQVPFADVIALATGASACA